MFVHIRGVREGEDLNMCVGEGGDSCGMGKIYNFHIWRQPTMKILPTLPHVSATLGGHIPCFRIYGMKYVEGGRRVFISMPYICPSYYLNKSS
jgi:hypothetical protein